MRRCCRAPQHVDLIVVGLLRRKMRSTIRQCPMPVHVDRRGGGLMFKFVQMDVIERRLQKSPQEREHTQYEAAVSHNSH